MLSARIRPANTNTAATTTQPHASKPDLTKELQNETTTAPEDQNHNDEDEDDAESLLSSFLPHLFPDDTPVCLGDPGQALRYSSPTWGDMQVWMPDYGGGTKTGEASEGDGGANRESQGQDGDGQVEAGRRLFAHYLWGGALVIADMIERELRGRRDDGVASSSLGLENVREKELWNVEGESVLELGAGAALPSMIALLAGAKNVTITDHPSAKGIYGSIPQTLSASVPTTLHNRIAIHPHTWGVLPGAEQGNTTVDAATKRELVFAESSRSTFSRIICADCLWMPEQHDNLARSIAWFLAPPAMPMSKARAAEAREGNGGSGGAAYVVAGFHTGREVVASFFENAVPGAGLKIERIYERDLNARLEDGRDGMVTREWEPRRPGETDRSRWCVVAFLRRRF